MKTKARLAGAFYLITIVAGSAALMANGKMLNVAYAANLVAGAAYVAVTGLFYELFKPVDATVSRIAALFSLIGCAIGAITSMLQLIDIAVPPQASVGLVFFGFYCVLIGLLVYRSAFLPRTLAVLMALGGLGWLTFLWPPLALQLSPYVMLPGVVGETALTLWLLLKGIAATPQPR